MRRGFFGIRDSSSVVDGVRLRVFGAIVGAMAWVLLLAGGAQAKMVMVGAKLPMQVEQGIVLGCESCVLTNPGLTGGVSDVSPVDGVILRWRLYDSGSTLVNGYHGHFRLRVLTPHGGEYVGAGRSVPVAPLRWESLEEFSTELPIRAGQLIGLELEDEHSNVAFGYSPTADPVLLEPAIADGEAAAPPSWWHEVTWPAGAIWPFNAEILPVPVVTGISPVLGPPAGGSQVRITGENFAEVRSVSFGSVAASYVVGSESEITATVPGGLAGSSVPVSVVTAAGRAEGPAAYAYEGVPAGPAPGCTVPKLKSKRLGAVRRILGRDSCRLGQVSRHRNVTARSGRVKKQSPPPGAALPSGGRVAVTLG